MSAIRPCVIIPTFDNPRTLRPVVEAARCHLQDVLVVDDGSGPMGRARAAQLARDGLATVMHRPRRGGKGAALKDGLRRARRMGFSHAVVLDADGQHATDDLPGMLLAAAQSPATLVLGEPIFDSTAPRVRRIARRLSVFWARVESGGRAIRDPLCGYRVYPIAQTLAVGARGDHMDYEPEVAVRLLWAGTPVLNRPTRVRYLTPQEGGVSHFRLVRDNLWITWMHTRLMVEKALRAFPHPGPRRGLTR